MKLTLNRSEMKQAIAGISKVTPNRATLPILTCVKFSSDGRTVSAHGTDLDQHIAYTFKDATCEEPGALIIDLQQLKDMVKNADSDQLEFQASGKDKVTAVHTVAGQRVSLQLTSPDVDDWPDNTVVVKTKSVDDFLRTFKRLASFASTDDTRYVLKSCYLDVSDASAGKSVMVSTDGRRLTLRNTKTLPLKQSCIVPTSKFLSWLDGDCRIGVSKQGESQWFAVESGQWSYSVKAVDATYPNYKQVIPPACSENIITFGEDTASIRQILKALPVDKKQDAIILRSTADDKLAVSTGDVVVDVPGSTFTGKCTEIGVSREYLMGALDAGFRIFTFADAETPLVSDDGQGGKHVLMPMRIDGIQTLSNHIKPEKTEEIEQPVEDIKSVPEKPEREGVRMSNPEKNAAIEKLFTTCEVARNKLKEAHASLADLAGIIKDTVREDKIRRSEVEDVRKTLAKIQALKV